jgi:hypothetical protein
VNESRQREFGADRVPPPTVAFAFVDRQTDRPAAGDLDRGGQPVRTRADHDRVVCGRTVVVWRRHSLLRLQFAKVNTSYGKRTRVLRGDLICPTTTNQTNALDHGRHDAIGARRTAGSTDVAQAHRVRPAKQRRYLITGGSRGLGLVLAREFAAERRAGRDLRARRRGAGAGATDDLRRPRRGRDRDRVRRHEQDPKSPNMVNRRFADGSGRSTCW